AVAQWNSISGGGRGGSPFPALNEGDFRPGERGALALTVEGAFAPSAEQMQAPLVLARSAQLLAVHVHAPGAAIDLGCTQLHQLQQLVIQAAISHVRMEL